LWKRQVLSLELKREGVMDGRSDDDDDDDDDYEDELT